MLSALCSGAVMFGPTDFVSCYFSADADHGHSLHEDCEWSSATGWFNALYSPKNSQFISISYFNLAWNILEGVFSRCQHLYMHL